MYVLIGRVNGEEARYAVVPCRNGWYQHFISGSRNLRKYYRYVRNETINDLAKWWRCEFDSFHYAPAYDTDQIREDLHYVWRYPRAFVYDDESKGKEKEYGATDRNSFIGIVPPIAPIASMASIVT